MTARSTPRFAKSISRCLPFIRAAEILRLKVKSSGHASYLSVRFQTRNQLEESPLRSTIAPGSSEIARVPPLTGQASVAGIGLSIETLSASGLRSRTPGVPSPQTISVPCPQRPPVPSMDLPSQPVSSAASLPGVWLPEKLTPKESRSTSHIRKVWSGWRPIALIRSSFSQPKRPKLLRLIPSRKPPASGAAARNRSGGVGST